MVETGTCRIHNRVFDLRDGCPECLEERQQAEKASHEDQRGIKGGMELRGTPIPDAAAEAYFTPPDEPETALIKVKPDLDEGVVKLYEQSCNLLGWAEVRVIKGSEDVAGATNDLSIISKLKKAIEEKRKEYVGPINDHLKAVNDAFKTFTDPLMQARIITDQKLLAYNAEQGRIREEQERINRVRVEAAQAEMKLKGELTESVNLVEVIPEVPKRVSTDMGTVGQRDTWKWEVVDFALVPDEYKMINPAILTPTAKSYKDTRTIPGIRIFNEPGITVNAR